MPECRIRGRGAGAPGARDPVDRGGTVSFVDEATHTPLGSLDVIPDLQQRLDEMDLVERAGYEIVRAENGDKFVDDMFVSPDGQTLYVSRSNLPDVVAIDLPTHEQVWRYEIEGTATSRSAATTRSR